MAQTQADPVAPKIEDNALLASRLERTTARIEGILSGAEVVILDACNGPPLPGFPDDRIEKAEISLVLVNVAIDLVRQMQPEFEKLLNGLGSRVMRTPPMVPKLTEPALQAIGSVAA